MELLVSVVLCAVVLILLMLLSRGGERGRALPPGPTPLPLLGNVLSLDRNNIIQSFMQLCSQYGPVVTVYLGPQRTVLLEGEATVTEALLAQAENFAGRAQSPLLLDMTKGYGLLISNGPRWQQLRRFTLTCLRDFGMGRKRMEEWIVQESRHLVTALSDTHCTPFDPAPLLHNPANNVLCVLVFSQRFNEQDAHFLRLLELINTILHILGGPWGQLYNVFPGVMRWLPGPHKHALQAGEEIKCFIRERIQQHRDTLIPHSPRDFIDYYLLQMDQEKDNPSTEFNYENLECTILNMFLAGTETVSTTLRFTFMLLTKYPHIQERVQCEIDSVVGGDRAPVMEDRRKLPLTEAVLSETQRLLDLVPLSVPHMATQDIAFKGYCIPQVWSTPPPHPSSHLSLHHSHYPYTSHSQSSILTHLSLSLSLSQGTMILPILTSLLKDKQIWADPYSFNPDHFLDSQGNYRSNPAFLPFSAGKRSCVGEFLARTELFLFLVSVLQRFTVSAPLGPDSLDINLQIGSFANLPGPCMLIAKPR
ncbi:cytochrome P450 2B11 isoform X1 [Amia ocellicauda]|uniref:cytochrome P450 2B11 isoform X1 n=1 Tax=Amia ocellicauda TaxID=2972642 RepID=UPI003464B8D5